MILSVPLSLTQAYVTIINRVLRVPQKKKHFPRNKKKVEEEVVLQ